jgi:hypothetical protein
MLAVYMPIIRKEIGQFVTVWNAHKIRKQNNRPNIVTGQPTVMYMAPEWPAVEHAIPLSKESYNRMREEVPYWDLDVYLPAVTQAWCNLQFVEMGFNPDNAKLGEARDRAAPYYAQYRELRARATVHIAAQVEPELHLRDNPTGVWSWEVRALL